MTRSRLVILAATLGVLLSAGAALWHWRAGRSTDRVATQASPTQSSAAAQTPAPSTSISRGDVSIDLRRQQLIGVRTVKAVKGELNNVIRAVGVVRSDETRVVDVNVKLEGWIRELTADFTGRFVRKGEPLLTLYSPDLFATEQEYLLALAARDQLRSSVLPDARLRAEALVSAARQRLELWDVSAEELRDLETSRQPRDALTFHASMSGVVTDKAAVKGAHVMPGQTLFKIADLSVVWVEADVYEAEMSAISVGGRAAVVLDAYPGERTTGRAIYISPYVDEQTRTSKVRYAFPNPQGRFKPGMFATVEIGTSGGVGITVPVDAVLDSGREQLVFVAQGDGYFTPRPVTIGRRLGGTVEILAGLKEGEEVASGATFFLDSESQLHGGVQVFAPPPVPSRGGAIPNADRLQIVLRTVPDPARTGENQFEVTVADARGPLTDADVAVQLFMPAMPTMNMPAMRNEVPLSPAGAGTYRGTGQVMMAGRWEATVTVTRAGQRIGSTQTTVVAR
jgi:Cu(I)/Ag(I) efflux system membrane fusion protein/cobalt-zinc-cadmium efflux system membrane fusion protein